MSDMHKSAMGRTVDMAALRAKNEHTRAVGNMNVNARGDVIDSNNEVINDNNKRVNEYYMKSAMNRGVRPTGINTAPSPIIGEVAPIQQTSMPQPDPTPVVEEFHPDELDFDDHDEEIVKEDPKSKKSNSSK
jgi:hypothetical protein